VDLGGVGVNGGTTGADACLQLNFFGDDAAQDLEGFFDNGLERNIFLLNCWPQREGADFVEEFAAARAGFKNLFEGFVGGMTFVDVHGSEFGAAEDAGDDVVEFVGDAAGELVEGVEFLFEQELFAGDGGIFGR
jgi:hypothetical protein